MRKKIKAILAVTLAVCMTLSGTVMAFAEGEDSGSAGGEGRHVESITINSETGSFESDPPDSVDVQNITSESCDVHTLADPDTGSSEQFVIDESTRVTIDGNNASQSSSRTDTDSITWYTYNVNSDDSSESDDDSNNDDSNNDDSSDCSKDKETSDDSKDKETSGDSDSGESQFTLWSPATVSTAGVTVGNVTTATLDPASSNYSSNFVSLIAETPQGGTLDLKITSSAYIDETIINALAARNDVSVNLTVNYMGVPFIINIPAGYNLRALLGADGRIDFAKLIATFNPTAK